MRWDKLKIKLINWTFFLNKSKNFHRQQKKSILFIYIHKVQSDLEPCQIVYTSKILLKGVNGLEINVLLIQFSFFIQYYYIRKVLLLFYSSGVSMEFSQFFKFEYILRSILRLMFDCRREKYELSLTHC